jgi:nucleotide-binding universal stress UspA family protein
MKQILLLTDFSDNARNALVYGIDLFGSEGVSYTLLNTYQDSSMDTDILISVEDILKEQSERALEEDFYFLQSKFRNENLDMRMRTEYGSVESVLEGMAKKEKFDFVVMGTNGKTGNSWFVGSVAASAVQHSPYPVIVVPGNAYCKTLKSIAYATNLYEDESNLIKQMVEFAQSYDSSLTFLHIDKNADSAASSVQKFNEIAEMVDYPKINFVELVEDDIEDAIVKYTEENKVSLLAATTYTTTLMTRLFGHSVTKKLMLYTHIPMLIFNRKKYSYIFLG